MQRPGITSDDADRVAQKSHELAECTIVSDGVGCPTGGFDHGDYTFFTGAIIQNATQSERAVDFLAESAVAIRRPAFRAPAPGGAQYDVPFDSHASQELQDKHFLNRRHREDDGRHAVASTCALRQFSILIGDVGLCAMDAIGVEDRYAELANRLRGKSDSA